MKIALQILLVIFFVITFTVVLISATFKFELLNYKFLSNSLEKNNVYESISSVVKNSINNQVGRAGGRANDISVLTDLITPENTYDFVDKNLLNLLNLINGHTTELYVYIPISKIPNDILPKNIALIEHEMKLSDLAARFNIEGLENLPLKEISQVGLYDYYILMISTAVLGVLFIFIMLSVKAGGRLIAPGMALVLIGIVTILFVLSGSNINKYIVQNFTDSTSINKILALTVIPPILSDVIDTWSAIGCILIIVGIVIQFVKNKK